MPASPGDRFGLLLIRASVEPGRRETLIIQLLTVDLDNQDRVVGIVNSPSQASHLVLEWLNALAGTDIGDTAAPFRPIDVER